MEGPWKEVVLGRLPAELTKRLRRVAFDHCQSSGGCSWALPVVKRCARFASLERCRTFPPFRCKRETLQRMGLQLSDANVHPSGKRCCVSHVSLLFLPSHTQDLRMLHALVAVALPMNP